MSLWISVQFSSFWFDNPGNAASPMQRRFSCRSWTPLVGDGDDIITELAWVTINGIAQTCFSGRAKGKFLFLRHHPSTEKTKGFSGIRTQDRAWARHWRLSLYQYTTATSPSTFSAVWGWHLWDAQTCYFPTLNVTQPCRLTIPGTLDPVRAS